MLWQIVQTKKGKRTIKMRDSLPICKNRIAELRSSYHGVKGIKFELEKSEENDKYEAKPIGGNWRSGQYEKKPKRVK